MKARFGLFLGLLALAAVFLFGKPGTPSHGSRDVSDEAPARRGDAPADASSAEDRAKKAAPATGAIEDLASSSVTVNLNEGAETVFEARTGNGAQQLGVGNEEQDPEGPMGFVRSENGSMVVIDSMNGRLQFRDASGRVLRNVRAPEGSLLRSVTSDREGNAYALDTNEAGASTLRVFDSSGKQLRKVSLTGGPEDFPHVANGYRLLVTDSGTAYAVGMEGNYRVGADGKLAAVPGVPFLNDDDSFVRLEGARGARRLVMVDSSNKVTASLPVENNYLSVKGIHTDAQGRAYLEFDHVLSSPGVNEGDEPVKTRIVAVEGYARSGGKFSEHLADRDGAYEVPQDVQIDRNGDVLLMTANKGGVKVTHQKVD